MSANEVYELGVVYLQFSKQQRLDFLASIRTNQCEIIQHVAYNTLLNSHIALTIEDRNYLRKHIGAIRKLASSKICLLEKRVILIKKAPVIHRLMKIAVEYIERERASLKSKSELELDSE